MTFAGTRTHGGCGGSGCCPDTECIIAEDDFDRANSTSIGGDWTEVAGDFQISTNKLVTVDTDAIAINSATYPGTGGGGIFYHPGAITVTLQSDQDGAQARIIGGYLDDENFVFAEWTFEAAQAVVRFGAMTGGVEFYITDGEYTIPGLGVSDATRVRFCWRTDGLTLTSVDDEFVQLTIGTTALPINGNKGGLGSGGTTGGEVRFDDFEASITTSAPCEGCVECTGCPDNQQVCIKLDGLPPPIVLGSTAGANWGIFEGEWTITRSSVALHDCAWVRVFSGFGNDVTSWEYLALSMTRDGDEWFLQVELRAGIYNLDGQVVDYATARYFVSLGEVFPAPDCSAFDCELLDFDYSDYGIFGGPFNADGDLPLRISVSSGTDCCEYEYADSPCCGNVDLPGGLLLTVERDGLPFITDQPLNLESQTAAGFEYSAESDTYNFTCFILAETITLLFPDDDEGEQIEANPTIESCEPFLATATVSAFGHTYEITISE